MFHRRQLALWLPAYLAGQLSPWRRRRIEARLATDPALRAASDELAELRRALRERDPAGPIDPTETRRLIDRLTAELPAAARGYRPGRRWLAAATLFVVGCLTGALGFPQVQTREIVRERTISVPVQVEKIVKVPVEKIVEVPVEKIVQVPVEKVVTRYRTETVYRERIVYRDRPAPRPTPAPAEVVTLRPEAKVSAAVAVAAMPVELRPGSVDF